MVGNEKSATEGESDFYRGTEKNREEGMVTSLGGILGEAVRVVAETNGGSDCGGWRSYKVLGDDF